ncbi:hypothetical protein ASPBRDRAFT_282086 [Aspergillus brasiliensis CBS 101740]|uniref:Uncharacterized protein n=1 Tax=Aspergillus brasiliensis (strain CBS 101740 / IMI 381727 / IBT 21946) TaxID=767769 RepID=A0A1L9UD49_ASPBC|nr:hypothetical protein ASPBRDRAFT_282086 [Aspergillus brasiliensis CBS 101740]
MHAFLLCCASKETFALGPLLTSRTPFPSWLILVPAGFTAVGAGVAELRRNPITSTLHCPALSPITLQPPHINQDADHPLDMPPTRNGVDGCSNRRVESRSQAMLTGPCTVLVPLSVLLFPDKDLPRLTPEMTGEVHY